MDYKRKYEQALENLKKIKAANENNKELVDFIEYKYPELIESEDENIRKTLIHIVKGACDKYGIKYQGKEIGEEKLLAWLEKQSEKNPAEWSEEDKKMLDKVLECIRFAEDHYQLTNGISVKMWLIDHINPQAEQEWSEEDEKYFKTALWHISNSVSNGKNTDIHCDTTEWLKALKQRMKGKSK